MKVEGTKRQQVSGTVLQRAGSLVRSCSAQASVEYLIVGLVIIAIIAALGLLGSRVQEGLFTEHAADSASHSVTTNIAGTIGDVLLY